MKVNVNTQNGDFSLNSSNSSFSSVVEYYDEDEIKARVNQDHRQGFHALRRLGVLNSAWLDKVENNPNAGGSPCPICGGEDRFYFVANPRNSSEFCFGCRQCEGGRDKKWTIIDLTMASLRVGFAEAKRLIAREIGVKPTAPARRSRLRSTASTFGAADRIKEFEQFEPSTAPPCDLNAEAAEDAPKRERDPSKDKRITYTYLNEDGAPVMKVNRVDHFDAAGGRIDKDVRTSFIIDGREVWKAPEGFKRPPYNLPDLLNPACLYVYIVEGEKSAEALQGLLDTTYNNRAGARQWVVTTLGGASNASQWVEHKDALSGKSIYILGDNDDAGYKSAKGAYIALEDTARIVNNRRDIFARVILVTPEGEDAPEKYDIADYIDEAKAQGVDGEELLNKVFRAIEAAEDVDLKEEDAEEDEEALARAIADYLPPLKSGIVDPEIESFAREIANSVNCRWEPVALACYSAFSVAAGFRFRAFFEGEEFTTPEFGLVFIGETTSSKSRILKHTIKAALKRVQNDLNNKAYRQGQAWADYEIIRTDGTIEGFTRSAVEVGEFPRNRTGIAYINDEISGFFTAREQSELMKKIGTITRLIDGEPTYIDQASDRYEQFKKRAKKTERVAFSLIGAMQPELFVKAFKRSGGVIASQGILQRLLLIPLPLGEVPRRRGRRSFENAQAFYDAILRTASAYRTKKRTFSFDLLQPEIKREEDGVYYKFGRLDDVDAEGYPFYYLLETNKDGETIPPENLDAEAIKTTASLGEESEEEQEPKQKEKSSKRSKTPKEEVPFWLDAEKRDPANIYTALDVEHIFDVFPAWTREQVEIGFNGELTVNRTPLTEPKTAEEERFEGVTFDLSEEAYAVEDRFYNKVNELWREHERTGAGLSKFYNRGITRLLSKFYLNFHIAGHFLHHQSHIAPKVEIPAETVERAAAFCEWLYEAFLTTFRKAGLIATREETSEEGLKVEGLSLENILVARVEQLAKKGIKATFSRIFIGAGLNGNNKKGKEKEAFKTLVKKALEKLILEKRLKYGGNSKGAPTYLPAEA